MTKYDMNIFTAHFICNIPNQIPCHVRGIVELFHSETQLQLSERTIKRCCHIKWTYIRMMATLQSQS